MGSLQEEFNLSSGNFILEPGEYEGPLVIRRPCVFDGSGATLWVEKGPVLTVEAPNVTIRNLRVEITGSAGGRDAAIKTQDPQIVLDNVTVCGNVVGAAGEAPDWHLPQVIPLGEFAADRENIVAFELEAAAAAELRCGLRDVSLSPTDLRPGKNRVVVKIGALRDNTILYGEIFVHTGVTRRIELMGKALIGALTREGDCLIPLETPQAGTGSVVPPAAAVPPLGEDSHVTVIARGQRLPAGELAEGVVRVVYEHQYAEPSLEIDGYVFLLQGNGKVRNDRDLIFFGNPESADQAVQVSSAGGRPLVSAELPKLETGVEKLAICCSIYGDKAMENFSQVDGPVIRVFHESRELYRFPLSDLRTEKTVVALEIYRYKGQWKLNFVGAGYRSGLKELCEGYGVQVE